MTYVSPPADRRDPQDFSPPALESPAPAVDSHNPALSDRLRALAPEAPRGWVWRWDRRSLTGLAVVLAALIAVVGWWAVSGPSEVSVPMESEFTDAGVELADGSGIPAKGDVVVHVAGEVASPGVITVPAGSRVHEAIEKAGGALKEKYLDGINLARVVVDGEQIVVGSTPQQDSGVSLNSASESELDSLTGIGPALAARIVEWRTTNGPFTSVDQLEDVAGIGPSLVASLRDQVRL